MNEIIEQAEEYHKTGDWSYSSPWGGGVDNGSGFFQRRIYEVPKCHFNS